MNVSTSTTAQMFQSMSNSSSKTSNLSLDQQTLIEDTLAKYDADSLSESDAQEIVGIFEEAGIEPSKDFASALSSVGFDAKEIGDLAGVAESGGAAGAAGGKPAGGPPPPPPSEEEEEEISSIYDLLETLLASEEEEEEESSTSSIISGSGYDESSSSFETVLDYTSKIVRLKDDAKSDVMNMLNEFNSDEANLDDEQTQKNLLSSLSDVLKKTDNYNTISFYA